MRAPQLVMFTAMAIFLMFTPYMIFVDAMGEHRECHVASGHYLGRQYWKQNSTLAARTVLETKFGRCQFHTVALPDGGVVKDWLWFDERDHINVLARSKSDGKFLVFRQTKYGLPKETLAPIGGFIEDGETPRAAAERELNEELGLRSHKWRKLGSFVTSVNRGGGSVHTFFADDCEPVRGRQLATTDLEAQRVVRLSEAELRDAVTSERFREVKWTAAVALALLTLDAPRRSRHEAARDLG